MNLKNPRKLRKGDTIAIVSPSAGLAELFPHRIEKGKDTLERLGFKIVFTDYSRTRDGWTSASPSRRADDINKAFGDSSISAIICSIGGNHSNQLLKLIDYDIVRSNPKIFLGYSDITVLHYAFAVKANLRTFYGPCLMTEFAEYPKVFEYTHDYFERALMYEEPLGKVKHSVEWTDEFLDWAKKKDLERPRALNKSSGYEWWKKGKVIAAIWGGTVPSINHLAGTEYWIDLRGKVLFLDIPEGESPEKPFEQSELDSFLADLDNLGVFESIVGLVIGRPYKYSTEHTDILKDMIEYYTRECNYPILYNANIGHTAPIITLPFGVSVTLDSRTNSFIVNESGIEQQ